MRPPIVILLILLAACDDRPASPPPEPRPSFAHDPVRGETRARIETGRGTVTELRSGVLVPVRLPLGLTIYPGAQITRNTLVTHAGARRALVEFETADPLAKVVLFHRAQAQAAGVALTLDLDGPDAASIGGRTVPGGDYALTVRRLDGRTVAQLALSEPEIAAPR